MSAEPGPVRLTGDRVLLRDWTPDDRERVTWLLDAARPWHATNGPYFGAPSAAETSAQIRRFHALGEADPQELPVPRTMLGIEHAGVLVGAVSWYWESRETDWRRMGIGIHDEAYWGRGLATEALALWTSYLFRTTDALRLDFATYSGNPAMIAVGRKLQFVCEGRFRKARRWSGGVHDSVVFGLLREEWLEVSRTWPGPRPAG